jgi:hypothetical protein
MVRSDTLISLTHQSWARPREMTRTIIIAIAAVLYVLAAGHAHHAIVNDTGRVNGAGPAADFADGDVVLN